MNPKQAVKLDACKKEPFDPKDYDAKLLMSRIQEKEHPQKYSVFDDIDINDLDYKTKEELIRTMIEDQGTSGSCVAQAYQYYVEILNLFDFGQRKNLSPRSIYWAIHLPDGGAFLRKGAKYVVNKGVSLERFASSYPATEEQLRKEISDEAKENALVYKSKDYTKYWQKDEMDFYARMIYENKGFVSGVTMSQQGWQDAQVRPPKQGEDTGGHALYFYKYDFTKDPKEVWALGSWGLDYGMDKKPGRHILSPDYLLSDYMFNVRTLVDKQNYMNILSQKLNKDSIKELYQIVHRRAPDQEGLEYWNGKTLKQFIDGVKESEEFQKYSDVFETVKAIEKWAREN